MAERRSLRIGIDYRPALLERPAGVGRAVRSFVDALQRLGHPHEVLLYADRPVAAPPPRAAVRLGPRTASRLGTLAWHLWCTVDVWRSGVDIYFATSSLFIPLLRPARCVVLVHDISALRLPWTHTWKVRAIHRAALRRAVHRAARVVVTADFNRRDLLDLYPRLDPGRIRGFPLGLDPVFATAPDGAARAEARARLGLPERYLLAVNTLEPRKNIPGLLRAYARLRASGRFPHRLVVVGQRGWLLEGIEAEARALGIGDDVVFTGFISDRDLAAVYALADVFVFPSFFEGFGLPLLEAMAMGTPIVTSPVSSMPEVAGDAALYADPRRPEEIADRVAEILSDGVVAERLRAAGRARVGRYTWEGFARGVLGVIEEAGRAVR